MEIELGRSYREIHTGFQGIAVEKHDRLGAITEVKLQPPSADNTKLPDPLWFPISRLDEALPSSEQ